MDNQTDSWEGQKKINGGLCRVDWLLVEALRETSNALAQLAASQSAYGAQMAAPDLTALNAWIEKADRISATVADIIPPGCLPRDRTGGDS